MSRCSYFWEVGILWLHLTEVNGLCSGSILYRHAVKIKEGQMPAQVVLVVINDRVGVDMGIQ